MYLWLVHNIKTIIFSLVVRSVTPQKTFPHPATRPTKTRGAYDGFSSTSFPGSCNLLLDSFRRIRLYDNGMLIIIIRCIAGFTKTVLHANRRYSKWYFGEKNNRWQIYYITWHESFLPSGYPAHIMLAVMRFSSYSVFLQSSLLMIGTYTSCSTCDDEPPCFFAPQPVMTPS